MFDDTVLESRKMRKSPVDIRSNHPLIVQIEFESGLWNRKIIQTLIFDLFEIKISVNTVDRLLKKIGLDHKTPESFLLVKNFIKHCQKVFYLGRKN